MSDKVNPEVLEIVKRCIADLRKQKHDTPFILIVDDGETLHNSFGGSVMQLLGMHGFLGLQIQRNCAELEDRKASRELLDDIEGVLKSMKILKPSH